MSAASQNPGFQTQTTIRRLLEEAAISPRKRYGQHFLIDANLMNKLLDAAEIDRDDCVLEVGTGTGCLTAMLAARASAVVTVEIDDAIASIAEQTLAEAANVTLIRGDTLKNKSTISPEVLSAIRAAADRCQGKLKLAANLPYDIATSLVIDLLLTDLPITRLCFTVQTEVAERFMAQPRSDDYGAVGIIAQSLASVRRICRVPPAAFWPRPKVDSTMLRLDPFFGRNRQIADATEFARFVRDFFLHRRKTLSHLVRHRPDTGRALAALAALGIDPRSRPEQLTVPQWQKFHELVR